MPDSRAGRARLFVALELPPELLALLAAWRSPLRASEALRLTPAASLHVTLCFLGNQPLAAVECIAAAIEVVRGAGPARLSPAEALWLPRRRPNVLAIRLKDHGGALERAQALLAQSLARDGWYEPERRAFLPHVTVARVRQLHSNIAHTLPDPPDGRSEHVFGAGAVTLFRSHLSPAGARYEPLASVALDPAPQRPGR